MKYILFVILLLLSACAVSPSDDPYAFYEITMLKNLGLLAILLVLYSIGI